MDNKEGNSFVTIKFQNSASGILLPVPSVSLLADIHTYRKIGIDANSSVIQCLGRSKRINFVKYYKDIHHIHMCTLSNA